MSYTTAPRACTGGCWDAWSSAQRAPQSVAPAARLSAPSARSVAAPSRPVLPQALLSVPTPSGGAAHTTTRS